MSHRSCSDTASSSTGSDADNDQTWDDWDEDQQPAVSLFDAQQFPSALVALQHDKDTHGVDLALIAATLDFFERIRLINWIRATKPDPASLRRLDRNAAFLDDDQYLKPVLEDDALLQVDFDSLTLGASAAPAASSSSSSSAAAGAPSLAPPVASTSSSLDPSASDLVEALRAQLADAEQANAQLRRIVQDRLGGVMGLEEARKAAESEKVDVTGAAGEGKGKGKEGEGKEGEEQGEAVHKDDDHYFESYQYNDIHEIMLKDRVRTNAYRDFIVHPANAPRFQGKVVLDVGCGTGILSMFAAKAGARKVYAVDASNVAYKAMRNIKANGFEGTIEVLKGKVEEIKLPEKVDVIISEWMGYCLLYECMLDSVLYARDKWLNPDGLMVPSQTSILLSAYAGAPYVRDRVTFWDEVYGFDMKAMKDKIEDEAIIDVVDDGEVVSGEVSVADIFTQTATAASLSFTSPFSLPITRLPSSHIPHTTTTLTSSPSTTTTSSSCDTEPFTLHGLLAHFDTYFTSAPKVCDSSARKGSVKDEEGEVFFTTGAWDTPTHWKQTLLLLKEPLTVEIGTSIDGTLTVSKNPDNSRELVVEAVWTVTRKDGKKTEGAQVWKVR
ncbi:hypothetical protein JCM6882_003128 [Rhodosporidiobolus microsporus]